MDGWVAVKCGCRDTFDANREQFALVALAAVEDNDFVGAGATEHPPATLLAAPFNKDFHSLADKRLILASHSLIKDLKNNLVALLLHLVAELVGHVGCRRVTPLRILEDVSLVELHFAHERGGLLKIFFGLTREANNDVGADGDVRSGSPEFVDNLQVPLPAVAAIHRLEYAI